MKISGNKVTMTIKELTDMANEILSVTTDYNSLYYIPAVFDTQDWVREWLRDSVGQMTQPKTEE